MANRFQDLDDFFDGALELPIGGKLYRIEPVSADVGLYVQRLMEATAIISEGGTPVEDVPKLRLDDNEEVDFYTMLLGDVYRALLDDKVDFEKIKIVATTVFIWVGVGIDAAEAYWNGGGNPKEAAKPSNRAERRARASTPTAGANTTKKRASGSGTRSQRASGKQSETKR